MYHVFDDVLTDDQIDKVMYFTENKMAGKPETLYSPEYASCFEPILNKAGECYDLSNTLYYEIWSQKNQRPPEFHTDRDEFLSHLYGIQKYPLCSTIFYLSVDENLLGGELLVETPPDSGEHEVIVPKKNRLVLLDPGTVHGVKVFRGSRYSVVCNPWDRPLSFYA